MKKSNYLIIFLLVIAVMGYGQGSQINGTTQVYPPAYYGAYGTLTFNTGYLVTPRNAPNSNVYFTTGSASAGQSDASHVNGYAEKEGTTAFTFPIGDGTTLRPAGISAPASSARFQAAYFKADPGAATLPTGGPFPTANRGTGVTAVSPVEYWDVNGSASTNLTLTWNAASNLATLTGNTLSDLIIVGYNPSTSQWENLGATAISGTLSGSGSITTSVAAFAPNTYTAYTFGSLAAPLAAVPFSCVGGVVYQVAVPTGSTTSVLSSYNITSGVSTTIATLSINVNGTGYNTVDNLIWGVNPTTGQVVSIDATGSVASYTIPNLPVTAFNTGEVITGGYLTLYSNNAASYYVIDINPARPATYLRLVDPATGFSLQAGPTYGKAISTPINPADWVYNSATGLINGITSSSGANPRRLFTLDLATGVVTLGPTASGGGIDGETSGFGGQFIDPSGSLYAFANNQGRYYKINQITGAATLLSTTSPASGNDGASCPLVELAPPAQFNCEAGIAYQVAVPSGETTSTLYSYNVATGVQSTVAPLGVNINGAGYSTVDNLIWGFTPTTGQVVRIDATGSTTSYTIPNLPTTGFNTGEVITGGYLVLYNSNGTTYYVVDINASRPATYLRLVDPATSFGLQTGPTYGKAISTPINPADWVYNSATNLINGITSSSGANPRRLFTLNLATGVVTLGPTASGGGIEGETSGFGGQFIDPSGSLYAFANNQGRYYKINQSTGVATLLSTTSPATSNDGISCPLVNLAFAISGNVFLDSNGLTDNTVNGTGTNAGGTLNAILYDNTTNVVSGIMPVAADGTFSFGALPGHSYTTYITTNTATIGQAAVPVVVLPTSYSSTGENLGAGAGNDGQVNGILSIGIVTADVSNANFGITGPAPDLTPVIYARPSTTYNTTPINVVVEVYELNNVATSGLITVKLAKDTKVSLTFVGGATSVGSNTVQNSIWTFDGTSDPDFYVLTTNTVIPAGDVRAFGLTGSLTPGSTTGTLPFSVVIAPNSGGETLITNNSDADKIDFFQQ
ncbi:beta strand repeat-containing protein [Spirosoma sp.]|uniref:beta strand repeat-containing protein n=1 Tax=Spirosoma sp. TaxID=1899569 RepID=UPI003B39FF34